MTLKLSSLTTAEQQLANPTLPKLGSQDAGQRVF